MGAPTTLLPTYVGAAVSFLACIAIGAVPGTLFGTLAEPTVLARVITGSGMVLGLGASLFFFLVAGAFLGTLAGLPFAGVLRRMAEAEPETTQNTLTAQR